MPYPFGGNRNPFGRYSLPNVLGRLFHGNSNPGPVSKQLFPTYAPNLNVGNVQTGGQSFSPSVNYGGSSGWQGPQPGSGTTYESPFAPTTGQGLDAVGQNYGAFQPQGLWSGSPSAGTPGTSSSIGGSGWATASGQAASGLLAHFMPRGDEPESNISRIRNR
jgi:hypothetical protein